MEESLVRRKRALCCALRDGRDPAEEAKPREAIGNLLTAKLSLQNPCVRGGE